MKNYIIPIIKKKQERPQKQLRLPIYREPPQEYSNKEKPKDKPDRGSTVVDFDISDDYYNN